MTALIHPTGVPADIDLDLILSDLAFDDDTGEALVLAEDVDEVIEPEEIIEAADEIMPDLEDLVVDEPAAEPAIEALSLDEHEERGLDAALGQLEAYESQESEVSVSVPEDDEIEAAPGAVIETVKTRKARAAKAPGAPRAAKDISTLGAEHFVLSTETTSTDPEDDKAALLASRPKQVKVAEKFDNVIGSLAVGKAPSGYVTKCFAVLAARGEVTSSDLVGALQADYTVGTSRSQAGQIMELFSVLGIATRTKQILKLNPDSTFAQKLRGVLTA